MATMTELPSFCRLLGGSTSFNAGGKRVAPKSPFDGCSDATKDMFNVATCYGDAVVKHIERAREGYVEDLAESVGEAVVENQHQSQSSNSTFAALLDVFTVCVPTQLGAVDNIYDAIETHLTATLKSAKVVSLKTSDASSVEVVFNTIVRNFDNSISNGVSGGMAVSSLFNRLKKAKGDGKALIVIFQNAEKIPAHVLGSVMELFAQEASERTAFIFGLSSKESWHNMLHASLPLSGITSSRFIHVEPPGGQSSHDVIGRCLFDLLTSPTLFLKLGPMCASEILRRYHNGSLGFVEMGRIFRYLSVCQLSCRSPSWSSEDYQYVEELVKKLPNELTREDPSPPPSKPTTTSRKSRVKQIAMEDTPSSTTSSSKSPSTNSRRSRGDHGAVRTRLPHMKAYWVNVEASCYLLAMFDAASIVAEKDGDVASVIPDVWTLLRIYKMTLESRIGQDKATEHVYRFIADATETDLKKLIERSVIILERIRGDTDPVCFEENQGFDELTRLFMDARSRLVQQQGQRERSSSVPASKVAAANTPSKAAEKPTAKCVDYAEHQKRLLAEIQTKDGKSPMVGGGSGKATTGRYLATQLRNWLINWLPSSKLFVSNSAKSSDDFFYYDKISELFNKVDLADMSLLLHCCLSKDLKQHLNLSKFPNEDLDVQVLFGILTCDQPEAAADGDMHGLGVTSPLSIWFEEFARIVTQRASVRHGKKKAPPIDVRELQARFLSALDELSVRGLVRYNPSRRTVTKLFDAAGDEDTYSAR